MKNKLSAFTLFIYTISMAFSCNSGSTQNENTNNDSISVETSKTASSEYSGVYTLSDDNKCKITITIETKGQDLTYQIKGDNLDCDGKIIVEQIEGNTYFTFDGQIAENSPKTVSGQYINGSIMIQNYGNAMNEFHFFKLCDDKFLEFKK